MTYPTRSHRPGLTRSRLALATATLSAGLAAQSIPDPGYFLRHDNGSTPAGVSVVATAAVDLDGDLRDDVAMLGSDGGIRIAHDPGIMTGFSRFRPGVVFTGLAAVARVSAGDPEYLITTDAVSGLAGHRLDGANVVTTLAPDNTWAAYRGLVVRHLPGSTQSVIAGYSPVSNLVRVARYVHGLGFINLTSFQATGSVKELGVVYWDAGAVPEIAVLGSSSLEIRNLAGGTLASFPVSGAAGSIATPDDTSVVWVEPNGTLGGHRVRLLTQAGAIFDATMTFAVSSAQGGPSAFVNVDAISTSDLDGDGTPDIALGQNDVPHVLMLRGTADSDSGALIGFDPALVVDIRLGIPTSPWDAPAPTIGQFDNHYAYAGVATPRYGDDGGNFSLDLDPRVRDVVQQNVGNSPWGIYAEENLTEPNWDGSTSELEFRLQIPGWLLDGMTHLEADLWSVEGTHSSAPITVNPLGQGLHTWQLHGQIDPNPLVHNRHSATLVTSSPFIGETWSNSPTHRPHLLAFVRVVKRNSVTNALEFAWPSFPILTAMGLSDNATQTDSEFDDVLDSLPPLYPSLPGTACLFDARDLPPPIVGVRKHIGKMKMTEPVPPPFPSGTAPVQGSGGTGTGVTSPN